MWSTRVYAWPEVEEKLASGSRPFALEVVRHGQTEANAGRRFSGASTAAGGRREPLRALACTHVGPMRVLIPVLRGASQGDGALTAKYANVDVFAFEPSGLVVPEFVREALPASAGAPEQGM